MRKRSRKAKKECLDKHTKRRLAERYGLRYTQYLRDTMLHQVRQGCFDVVVKQSNRVSVYDVVVPVRADDLLNPTMEIAGDKKIRCVYDKTRKTFITVLEPNMVPPKPDQHERN